MAAYLLERIAELQWGPVVVTGISAADTVSGTAADLALQWGPVVVTGIRRLPPCRRR